MQRDLLACFFIVLLATTARGQKFDPAYKPEPGDSAVIGYAVPYGRHVNDELNQKYVFLGFQAFASLDGINGTGKLSEGLEQTPTYVIPSAPRYRLKAGTRVNIIAKAKTTPIILFSQYVQQPIYEIQLLEEPFLGKHLYILGDCLQRQLKGQKADWDDQAEALHLAVLYEDDNPEFALERYKSLYLVSAKSPIGQLAKSKLLKAGKTLPLTPADDTPAMIERTTEKMQEEMKNNKTIEQPNTIERGRQVRGTRTKESTLSAEAPDGQSITIMDCNFGLTKYLGTLDVYRVTAVLKNTTGRPLKLLKVTAIFQTANLRLLHTEYRYAEPELIEPGETATVEINTRENLNEISRFELKFEAGGHDIKYRRAN